MALAHIGLGSNLGDGRRNLGRAWTLLGRAGGIRTVAISSPYSTSPVGMQSPQRFTNAVGLLQSDHDAPALLALLLGIEAELGRRRDPEHDGPRDRTVDLDLLDCAGMVLNVPDLVLPHPEMANRLFVLMPLLEVDPGYRHPVSGLGVSDMIAALPPDTDAAARQAWRPDDFPDV